MKRFVPTALLTLLVLLAVMPIPAPCADAEFDKSSIRLVDRAEDKSLVIVEMTKAPIASNFPYAGEIDVWGGCPGQLPKDIISAVTISVSGKKIDVPLSVYGNLGWPSHVWLNAAPGGFVVKIEGGDAAASHEAFLFFVGNRIVRKLVVQGEFPDNTEEITYP